MLPHCLRAAFAVVSLFLCAVAAHAQGTGSIQGRVYNPNSQQYVRDAEVRLEGTNQVVFTGSDGSFQFSNVPAGSATVSVSFTGYDTAKDTFSVTPGQIAVREINLVSPAAGQTKDGVVQLQAFTVASQREGNSKAIMAQRKDMNIVTAVSADIFGDVTDGNVGEFLKYLPGVDLDYVESEPRGPRLGGMDGQYVGVAMDGMRTASADANRGGGSASRATSFEGFSITSIDSIEINRTASPENDADSPAGTVNMKTKRAFDRKGRRVDYNIGANFNSDSFTIHERIHPDEHAQYQWKPNWQFTYAESFFDQKFGLLLGANRGWSLTQQTTETMDYATGTTAGPQSVASVVDNRPMVVRQIDYKDGPKWIQKDALLLTADWRVTPRLTLSLNLQYSYFSGDFWNRNFTFVAANNNNNAINGRSTVRGDGLLTVIAPRDLSKPTNSVVSGALVDNGNNGVATLNWGGGAADKKTWTRQYSPRFEYKFGPLVVDGAFAFSKSVNRYDGLAAGFSTAAVGGVASGWTATRPNDRSWEWTIRQNTGADWFDMKNWTSTNTQTGGTSAQDRTEKWTTEKYTGVLNARYALPFMERFPTTVKVGGKWDEESRINHNWNGIAKYVYTGPGGNTVTYNPATEVYSVATFGNWANLGPEYISPLKFDTYSSNMFTIYNVNGTQGTPPRPAFHQIADLYHAHPEMFVNTANVNDYYNSFYANERNFRQTITAAYAQADTRLTSQIQIRFGLRWEQTKNRLKEFNPLTPREMLSSPYSSQFTAFNSAGVAIPNNSPASQIARVTPALATSKSGIDYQFTHKPRTTRTSKYDDYFPSLLVKYNPLPNLEWQAGVNKGISRPPIDNLTGLWSIDDNATPPKVSAPNPNLEPEHHKVYQTRVAYYFGTRSPGQVSIALIQDEAVNFISSQVYHGGAAFGVEDPQFADYDFVSTYNIPGTQRYRNMDLNYQQTLGFLSSEYLRGINLGLTYSRSYANMRRKIAPRRLTFTPSYTFRRFNAGLGIIWTDKRPEDNGSSNYGRYFNAFTKIDVRASYKINNYATLYVQVRNITNVKDLQYWTPTGYEEGTHGVLRNMEQYGANWVFGVKGSF
jgi:TonB-dependent receptor